MTPDGLEKVEAEVKQAEKDLAAVTAEAGKPGESDPLEYAKQELARMWGKPAK